MEVLLSSKFMKKIIQFGVMRSGSTYVYNVVKNLLPADYIIVKTHKWSQGMARGKPTICTYRNPLDVVASSLQRLGAEVTDQAIDIHIKKAYENGFESLLEPRIKETSLMLKYELFLAIMITL